MIKRMNKMIPNNKPLKLNSKYILLLTMIYVTVSVAADVVAFKFAYFFGYVESGATLLFPITYLIGDVVCEDYGWDVAMKMAWNVLACEGLFALLITIVIHTGSMNIGQHQNEYTHVLGNMWLFVCGGIISNAVAGLLNIFFISKWKILAKGNIFWVRSIISTCISEFLLILITVLIAFVPFIQFKASMHVFINAYVLEIIYACLFVYPAQKFVGFLKRSEGIDVYDYGISYNPFRFFDKGEK